MRVSQILLAGVSLLALVALHTAEAGAADGYIDGNGSNAEAQPVSYSEPAPDAEAQAPTGVFAWFLRGQEKREDLALSSKLHHADIWRLRNMQPEVTPGSLLRDDMGEVYEAARHYRGQVAGEAFQLRGYLVDSLENSDKLKAELHRANAAHAASEAAIGAFLPKVTLQVDHGEEGSDYPLASVAGKYDTGTISGEWTLFSSGMNLANLLSARARAGSADMKYLAAERRQVYDSLVIYLQLYAAQKLVASIEDTLSRLDEIRVSTNRLFGAGFASRTDIAQVESEIASVRAQYEQAASSLREQEIAFTSATGRNPPAHTVLPRVDNLLPSTLNAALDRALAGNFTIGASDLLADSAEKDSHAAMARYLPRVSLYGSADTRIENSNYDPFADRKYNWDVGVRLTVPLADFSASGTYRQARETAFAARYDARDTRRQVVKEIETSWSSFDAAKGRTDALRQRAAAQEKVVIGLRKQVEAGMKTVNDLLRAEIDLTRARIEIIQNQVNETASAYRIAIQYPDLAMNELAPY